jgi:hypothetical protein
LGGTFCARGQIVRAVTLSYIETLKKLGKNEASLLKFFAGDTSPTYSEKFYEEDNSIFSDSNPLRKGAIDNVKEILESPESTLGDLREFMDAWGVQGVCRIIFFSIRDMQMVPTKFFREHEHVISNLEHLGLISIQTKQIKVGKDVLEITWFQITKYAFDMMWACEGVLTGSGKRRVQ